MRTDTPLMATSSTLKHGDLQLEVMNERHRQHLEVAAQDAQIWQHTLTSAYGDQFATYFDRAMGWLDNGEQLPFVIRRISDHKILGSTRYYNINSIHKNISIGYTWYIPEVWGSAINPTCKFLLLESAFENMFMNRVEFMTDKRNARSRNALLKLGAKEEGLLRHHMINHNGMLRDSYVFSIIKPEWETVKEKLLARLGALISNA